MSQRFGTALSNCSYICNYLYCTVHPSATPRFEFAYLMTIGIFPRLVLILAPRSFSAFREHFSHSKVEKLRGATQLLLYPIHQRACAENLNLISIY